MNQPRASRVPRSPFSQFAALVALGALGAVAGLGLLASGCSSPSPRGPRGVQEIAQPPLEAHTACFAATVEANAVVTAFRRGPLREGPSGESGSHDRHPGGGRPDGPPSGGGHGGFGPPPGGGGHRGASESGGERPMSGGLGQMPRQTLRVAFTNHAETAVTFAITELRSAVGNFVPQPASLTIEPGATASLEPVSGDAGGVLNWLDLTIGLRKDGQTESHTLHLVPSGATADGPAPDGPPPLPPEAGN